MSKWIRAKEQLPTSNEYGKTYAILKVDPVWENEEQDGPTRWCVGLAYFDKDENKFYVCDAALQKVSDCYDVEYWMELPEAPVDGLDYDYWTCEEYYSQRVDELEKKVDMLERALREKNKQLIAYEKKEWKHIV